MERQAVADNGEGVVFVGGQARPSGFEDVVAVRDRPIAKSYDDIPDTDAAFLLLEHARHANPAIDRPKFLRDRREQIFPQDARPHFHLRGIRLGGPAKAGSPLARWGIDNSPGDQSAKQRDANAAGE